VGNYFRAEVYTARGWNTWREADARLRDLRQEGRVAFAAVDSSILETQPRDSRGPIVLETEMSRARNPEGEDWGAPSWRWFRPSTLAGRWRRLEALTDALVMGVRRVEDLRFSHVLALVNPRAYFLALAAALRRCGCMDRWTLFRVPAHPRHLIPAVRQVVPLVRAAIRGRNLRGGVYPLPDLYAAMRREANMYRHPLPMLWAEFGKMPSVQEVEKRWASLVRSVDRRKEIRPIARR